MTADDLVKRLEKIRADPEEEIRFEMYRGHVDPQNPQEIINVQRLRDEDNNPFINILIGME